MFKIKNLHEVTLHGWGWGETLLETMKTVVPRVGCLFKSWLGKSLRLHKPKRLLPVLQFSNTLKLDTADIMNLGCRTWRNHERLSSKPALY